MTELNPNYEFAGGSCSIQDLMEVDRDNLMLVKQDHQHHRHHPHHHNFQYHRHHQLHYQIHFRALGQGAFGEVYQGLFKKTQNGEVRFFLFFFFFEGGNFRRVVLLSKFFSGKIIFFMINHNCQDKKGYRCYIQLVVLTGCLSKGGNICFFFVTYSCFL